MRSFQITFCGYTVFPDRVDFVRRFSLRDETGAELSDAVGIIFVELTKLSNVMNKSVEAMMGEEFWALFLAIGSDPAHRDLLKKMIAARREIGMAVELLQTISKDENERARFRARRKFQMDMEHSLIVARDEAMLTVAKNLLKRNRPINEIVEDTGLTHKEVEALRVSV
jgi:predicted transposase/invertase (TIGR01784 family)